MVNRIALKNIVHGIGRRCAIGTAYTGVAGGESIVADKKQNQPWVINIWQRHLNLVRVYILTSSE